MKQLILLPLFAVLAMACGALSQPTATLERSDPGPDECQDAVHVVVWGDLNGDGVQDEDEPPLPDVLIMLVPRGDAGVEKIQQTTTETGDIYFPTRELSDCVAEGYDAVFARQVEGYEFPNDPVFNLDNFKPDIDIVEFGLVRE